MASLSHYDCSRHITTTAVISVFASRPVAKHAVPTTRVSIYLQSESALQKHLPANHLPCLMAYGLEILEGPSRQPGAGVSIVVKLLSQPHPGWKYWRVQARSWWTNLELVSPRLGEWNLDLDLLGLQLE